MQSRDEQNDDLRPGAVINPPVIDLSQSLPLGYPSIENPLAKSLEGFALLNPQVGRTVTIFLCGTCSNSEDYKNPRYFAGENVSHTYQITSGKTNFDKIIVDGPGSGEVDVPSLWVNSPMYEMSKGMAFGWGVEERLKHIVAILTNKPERLTPEIKQFQLDIAELAKTPIDRINIVGWSRGGAAAIELTHRLAGIIHAEYNLILLDPVPGGGQSHPNNRKLPNTVKNCYVIYMEDERSAFFNPVVPDCPEGCNFVPIILPGGHAQVAGDDKDHAGKSLEGVDIDLKGVGKISRYIVELLLQQFGTQLEKSRISEMTLKDLLAEHEVVKKNREHYKEIATRVSYTFNQIQGAARKVIAGNDPLLNEYFDKLQRKWPAHSPDFLNHFHMILASEIQAVQSIIHEMDGKIQSLFIPGQEIEIKAIHDLLNDILAAPPRNIFSNVAIKELLLEKYGREIRPFQLDEVEAIRLVKNHFTQKVEAHHLRIKIELQIKEADLAFENCKLKLMEYNGLVDIIEANVNICGPRELVHWENQFQNIHKKIQVKQIDFHQRCDDILQYPLSDEERNKVIDYKRAFDAMLPAPEKCLRIAAKFLIPSAVNSNSATAEIDDQATNEQEGFEALREKFKELLAIEHRRLSHESWGLFQSSEKTELKRKELGKALASLDSIHNITNLRQTADTLLKNNDLMGNRRHFDFILSHISFFNSPSKTRQAFEDFMAENPNMRMRSLI